MIQKSRPRRGLKNFFLVRVYGEVLDKVVAASLALDIKAYAWADSKGIPRRLSECVSFFIAVLAGASVVPVLYFVALMRSGGAFIGFKKKGDSHTEVPPEPLKTAAYRFLLRVPHKYAHQAFEELFEDHYPKKVEKLGERDAKIWLKWQVFWTTAALLWKAGETFIKLNIIGAVLELVKHLVVR